VAEEEFQRDVPEVVTELAGIQNKMTEPEWQKQQQSYRIGSVIQTQRTYKNKYVQRTRWVG